LSDIRKYIVDEDVIDGVAEVKTLPSGLDELPERSAEGTDSVEEPRPMRMGQSGG
jgi:hypothetical protein